MALADFIDPAGSDTLGLFAVTTGHGVDERTQIFKDANDDYRALMLQALADRLAEAFAERLHQRVRTEFWAYAADEQLPNDALIAEEYQGIRPAPTTSKRICSLNSLTPSAIQAYTSPNPRPCTPRPR
jgi:5-methyltetrahydrofolate--homocysteine methyltransferase